MHRILLEDGAKLVRQPQRRLNPMILDVVKKEVTKLLQAGIIYPILDSQKYKVLHRISTPYHPQTNRQAEISIRELKRILEKIVQPNRKDWSNRLDDAH
uniref:Transposon Ty3-I Gag-Pol polyprotein n=1 Tax=Cajanus cajan TaxID=3821 RepID=A0A151R189_CAJCA|nr:hypothetical protein KK1_042523 [Cajanus cajan]